MANKKNNSAKGDGNIRKRADGRWEGRYTLGMKKESANRMGKFLQGLQEQL